MAILKYVGGRVYPGPNFELNPGDLVEFEAAESEAKLKETDDNGDPIFEVPKTKSKRGE